MAESSAQNEAERSLKASDVSMELSHADVFQTVTLLIGHSMIAAYT
jgi:hypothetical protein